MSNLFKRHLYLNRNIDFIISKEIIEYDIRSAGFSLIKKYNLLDKNKISYLEKLDKKSRHIQIGLFQKEDKKLNLLLNEKFTEIRKIFFESNNLLDDDILSIKKDAIYTLKSCNNTEFGDVVFQPKNIYTSYYNINKFEFYSNKNKLDLKGISDSRLEKHREYFLDFLHSFFNMMEISSKERVIKYLKEFSYYYKSEELDIRYYRELNRESYFRLKNYKLNNEGVGVDEILDKNLIYIGYNYINYVLPLISLLI